MDSQSQLTEVTEHLFVGGVCAINDEIIQSLNTKRILIVNATKNLKDYSLTSDGVGDTRVEVVRVPVDDNVFSSISPYFKVSRRFGVNIRVGQNFWGYLPASFSIKFRMARITYGGTSYSKLGTNRHVTSQGSFI